MSKKIKPTEQAIETTTDSFIEVPTPIEAKVPSLIPSNEVKLKIGYVFAKLKGTDTIVQVSAKQVGKAYTEDKWEFLTDKKK
jgi:hypothetical protein